MAASCCQKANPQVIPMQIKAAIVAVVLASAFLGGWWVNGWRWEAKLADAQQKAETERIELAQDNADIIEAEAENAVKIIYKTKTIYKEVARIAGPAQCIDDERVRFVANWNEIIRQTSEPSDTVQ